MLILKKLPKKVLAAANQLRISLDMQYEWPCIFFTRIAEVEIAADAASVVTNSSALRV